MCTSEVGEYFLTLDIILEEKIAWALCGIEERREEERMNEIYSEFGGGTMVNVELFLLIWINKI